MTEATVEWVEPEAQLSFVRQVFDLAIHDPIELTRDDVDDAASLSIGQNRAEMALDEETVEILTLFMADAIAIPMPLVWRATPKTRGKVVVLDGNHRIAAAEKRGERSFRAILLTGDSTVAQRLAVVVNTQHGRSTRSADYVAATMRLLREQGVPIAQIARMFGVPENKVGLMTRRDAQIERLRSLLPQRRGPVKMQTLDLLAQVEDDHVKILGDLFLDAPKSVQEEYVDRLKSSPSAARDTVAHEIVGELREQDRARRKVKVTSSRPASNLQGALQRLTSVTDPVRAYFASSDQQKAIMRANLATVLPRLVRLSDTIAQQTEVA